MWRAARVLYLLSGGLWLMIGLLTPPLLERGSGPSILFVSTRTDAALFGRTPSELLASDADLATFRAILLRVVAGLLVAVGLLTLGVAWFGLAEPRTWPVGLLTAVGVAVIPYWWIALRPYRAAAVTLSLTDLPPFMWVPALLMPLASLLAWIDLARA